MNPVRGPQYFQDHRHHDHGSDEERRIGDHLHRTLVGPVADLVERERQQNRHGKPTRREKKGDPERIHDDPLDMGDLKNSSKLVNPTQGLPRIPLRTK